MNWDGIVSIDSSYFDSLVVEKRWANCVSKRMKKKRRLAAEAEEMIIGMVISFKPETVPWWYNIGKIVTDKLYAISPKY